RVEKFGQLGYRDLSELQRAFERRQRRLASNHRTTLALYPYLLGTCARHVGNGIDDERGAGCMIFQRDVDVVVQRWRSALLLVQDRDLAITNHQLTQPDWLLASGGLRGAGRRRRRTCVFGLAERGGVPRAGIVLDQINARSF